MSCVCGTVRFFDDGIIGWGETIRLWYSPVSPTDWLHYQQRSELPFGGIISRRRVDVEHSSALRFGY